MNKQIQRLFVFVGMLLACLTWTTRANAFTDIKADFRNGSFFADGESGTYGLAVGTDGTVTRVAADDASSVATITGKFHSNEHGLQNFSAVVPVEGAVKITFGTCAWGGNVTVKDATGATVTTFNTNTGACYHNNTTENVVSGYYKVNEATTLTISGGSYVPYFAVEAVDPSTLVEETTVTFSAGTAEGVAPAAVKAEVGSSITLPLNRTLYVEGSTMTGWSDGTNTYAPGDSYEMTSEDVTLNPVFTQNTVAFADRESEVTAIWDFQQKNGAPVLNYQNKTGIYVTQIEVNGQTIDFKMDFDTNNGGKLANGSWLDWAQVNNGTTFTLPMYAGTVVSTFSMGDNSATTFAGGTGTYANNVNTYTYEGSASTMNIVISGGTYYRWVQAFYPVPSGDAPVAVDVNVAFSLDGVDCAGQLVATGGTYTSGDDFTLPAANYTLYKEGYTLTGWTDGTNEYELGATVSLPAEDVTFTPVFTQNTVSLADRSEAVTVKWNFRRDQGAPIVQWQNQTGLVWVAQAEVNGETIDVALPFSTNPGKFNNSSWNDWAQLNNGTTFTVPSCKGATISMEAFNNITTTTIDGQSDYTQGKTISYTIGGSAETVDVVIGDGTYYRYIQVVLPVVQSQGGASFDNVAGTITWAVGNEAEAAIAADAAAAVSATSVSVGSGLSVSTASYSDVNSGTMVKYRPSTSNAGNVEDVMIEYRVKAAAGVKFTPSTVTFNAVKVGTDGAATSWGYTADDVVSTVTDIAAADLIRNNGANSATAQLTHTVDVSAAGECEVFTFRYYISKTANNKDQCLGNVIISGTFNGTVAEVATYALTVAAAPAEGGTVTAYPAADEYEEGEEVTLTATENFGYNFVNWTDAEGNEVSTDAKFKYTVSAAAELTANFTAVETYELALTVDGTNDYMVTVDPAPTVVDGKNMYEDGTTVVLTANQYENLVTFNNWSDSDTNSEKTITMSKDVSLTATYSETDIIAGWDFYNVGNNGRKADFYGDGNDAAALSLVKTEDGTTSGWLDKSTLNPGNSGYESFKGAAVNWRTGASEGDVGNYHWQTKVNAEAFTDIKVQFQMLYNFNAYKTYNVEWSTDGETWENAGSITMAGAKNVASFNATLPEEANNQAELYIRMIADKTSEVDGTASKNDGNALAMFFITGTPKLVNDGIAPVLKSTVPAEGADNASATGKIVLTFDEKVKVADGTMGTLNGESLTPTVSGKTVTFAYKGLDYATNYTFELPANSVADLTDNYMDEAITLSFTTMARPSVEKGLYDFVVPNDGTIVEAITAAAARSDKNVRFRIFVKNGEYTIPLYETTKTCNEYEVKECITFINSSNISFIGESRDGVVITNAIPADATFEGKYGTTSKYDGIGNSDVFQIASSVSGLYWQDLTVSTGMEDARGRDIAIQDKGTKNIYKNVKLHGYQDTWDSNNDNGLYYFEGGIVRGRTDFLCGKGDIFFNGVELQQIAGGYAAVPSKPANIGWVFKDCVINGDGSGVDGNYTLGRPWGSGTPVAVFIDTKMNVVPSAIGWSEMSGGWPARFAEYNSTTASGTVIDLSGRKTTFGDGHTNNPELTAEEAAAYSDMSAMYGDWMPTLYTEQAPVPTDVVITGNELSWTGSEYALLYAICKDGSVIAFTTDETYTLDDMEGEYTIRAANEMGGLSEQSEAAIVAPQTVTVTIKEGFEGTTISSPYALDLTQVEGLTAYIATGKVGTSKVYITTQSVSAIAPAETGLLIKGTAGTYEIPVATAAAEADAFADNLLVGAVDGYTPTDADVAAKTIYRYGKNASGCGFLLVTKTTQTVSAGKAYLRLTDEMAAAAATMGIEFDVVSAISTIQTDGVQADQPVYNLNGQRVNRSYKGVVISGGQKRVNK